MSTFTTQRALTSAGILLRERHEASARVMTLATTVGTDVFPGLRFFIEFFGFLPDVLARRYIFKWLRNLLGLVGRWKKSGKCLRRTDLGERNTMSFR